MLIYILLRFFSCMYCPVFFIVKMYIVHNSTDLTEGILKLNFFSFWTFKSYVPRCLLAGHSLLLKDILENLENIEEKEYTVLLPSVHSQHMENLIKVVFFYRTRYLIAKCLSSNLFILIVRNNGWNPEKVLCFIWSEMGKQINWKY